MHVLLGLSHIGTLLDQFRRHAHGKILGQRQPAQVKRFRRLTGRQPAQQCGQGIARLTQLLLQRRQRLGCLRLCGFLGENIQVARSTQHSLAPNLVGQLALHIEQPLRRRDLPAQRGLLHRGHDHIAAQGKVGGLELKAGALLLRLGHLDRAARGTEHIGHVAQCELRRVKIVGVIRCRGGSGQRADGILRADAAEAALEVRKKAVRCAR